LRSDLPDLDRVRLLCTNGAKLDMPHLQLFDHIRNGQTLLIAIVVENGAIGGKHHHLVVQQPALGRRNARPAA